MKLPTASTSETPKHLANHEAPCVLEALNALKDKHILPNALPRAMLRAFKDRYKHKIAGLKNPGVLDELIAHVLGNTASGSHASKDADVRRRVELFLDSDEGDAEEIIIDLRRHNGNSEVYTYFYQCLAEYLATEESKVDPRRHQGLSQCPLAWSVPNLIKNVRAFVTQTTFAMPMRSA